MEEELVDFIFFVVYQKSESVEKLRYSVLFDLIDGKLPGLNATSSEGGRKRPESSSPEKLKARNKEKFSGASEPEATKQHEKAKKDDNYEDEFEQLLDKDDEDEETVGKIVDSEVNEVNKNKRLKPSSSSSSNSSSKKGK